MTLRVDFRSPDTTRFPVGVLLSQTAATEANFSQNLRGAGINQFASDMADPAPPMGAWTEIECLTEA
jgi:hypothetical protein